MEDKKQRPIQWLWGLFYCRLAGALLSALVFLATALSFSLGSWHTWAQQAVSVGIAVCLYLLPGNYRYAGMAKAMGLLSGLICLAFRPVLDALGVRLDTADYNLAYMLLNTASQILALIAMTLEYITHASIVPGEKGRWYGLLACSLAVSVSTQVVASLLKPLLNTLPPETFMQFAAVWNPLVRTLGLGVSIAYLLLLRRLIRHQEEVN